MEMQVTVVDVINMRGGSRATRVVAGREKMIDVAWDAREAEPGKPTSASRSEHIGGGRCTTLSSRCITMSRYYNCTKVQNGVVTLSTSTSNY